MIEKFNQNNIKLTKQRIEIYKNIENNSEYMTMKKLLKTCSDINKSTIYRILELFLEKGLINKKINDNNEIFYEISDSEKHFIKCIKCNETKEINCPINVIDIKGFKVINHLLEINAICNKCYLQENTK